MAHRIAALRQACLGLLLNILSLLPLPALYLLARWGAALMRVVLGYRREIVRENLYAAFGDRNATEITYLEKSFYLNLAMVAVEILRARRMPQAQLEQRALPTNPEVLRSASDNFNRPLVILTLHQGNWEWMLHGTAAHVHMPIVPLYKPLHEVAIDQFIYQVRSRFGAKPLPLSQAPADILRHRATPRCIVIVADQTPASAERCHTTRFLGLPTAFHTGPARLAKRMGASVVFVSCRRKAMGKYSLHYELLAQADEALTANDITERYARAAEQAIHREPQSWLWSHRRWRQAGLY